MTTSGKQASCTTVEPAQLASYRDNGYLLIEQVVPPGFLRGVQDALEGHVEDRISAWTRAGLLAADPLGGDFGTRYHQAWLAAGQPAFGATAPDERRLTDLLAPLLPQRWLTDLAIGFLGASQVTLLDSCYYRAKFPGDQRTSLPWHQDAQCLGPVSGNEFVTAWIPLVDVSDDSSCLEVSPVGDDREVHPATWSAQSSYVCMQAAAAERLVERRQVRMRRGDLLVMSPFVPHRSLDNAGTATRWSIDLRFSPD